MLTSTVTAACAAAHAYRCSPAVPAFEALAYGYWYSRFGQAEGRGLDLGAAMHDERYLDVRRRMGALDAREAENRIGECMRIADAHPDHLTA